MIKANKIRLSMAIALVAAVSVVGALNASASAKSSLKLGDVRTDKVTQLVPVGTNPNCAWFREGVTAK